MLQKADDDACDNAAEADVDDVPELPGVKLWIDFCSTATVSCHLVWCLPVTVSDTTTKLHSFWA